MNLAHLFAATLKELGIRYLFGVPSGSMIDYMEAVRKTDGIDFILTTHEAGAAFMAGVCGRLTGIPGACFATFGPGATNLSTGVGAALLDRAPLMAFTDVVPDHLMNRTVQMNIDHQALFTPLTKAACRLDPENAARTLIEYAGICRLGIPGPVHIGIPSNLSQMEIPAKTDVEHPVQNPLVVPKSAIDTIKLILEQSKKPVLALGLTAARKEIKPLVFSFLDQFSIPVVLTPMAKGVVPEDHPCYAGVLNHALSHRVAKTHTQADLVIGIGYDPVEIRYEEWVSDQPIIHIDRKQADIDPEKLTLACDVTADVVSALETLSQMELPEFAWDLGALQKRTRRMFSDLRPQNGLLGPVAVLETLRRILPKDGILTCDVGAHLHLIGQKWITPEPGTLLMTNGWSAMGFAIPAAIAAKLCRPNQNVACVTGDGGFLMSAGELATAQRLELDIVFILLVDHDLSLIRIKQEQKGVTSGYGTQIFTGDLFDTPSIFGVPVLTAKTVDEIESVMEKAFETKGPVIVKAMVDPGEYHDLLLKGNG